MKKIIALLLCVALTAPAALAETAPKAGTTEIELSYGVATVPEFVYLMGSVLGITFTLGYFDIEHMKIVGAPALGCYHYLNDHIAVGGEAVYDYMTADQYSKKKDGEDYTKEYVGKFNMSVWSVMPGAKFDWFDNGTVGMYSKVNAGVSLYCTKDQKPQVTFAAQLTPIGIELGSGTFRGYAELGAGCRGVFTVGVKKSF